MVIGLEIDWENQTQVETIKKGCIVASVTPYNPAYSLEIT